MTDDAPASAAAVPYLGSWRLRRRVIFYTLGFCGADVGYLSIFATDTALHQQIGVALVALAATVIGSYVFGAVWDDHNIRKSVT